MAVEEAGAAFDEFMTSRVNDPRDERKPNAQPNVGAVSKSQRTERMPTDDGGAEPRKRNNGSDHEERCREA
ncbi:MAG: hypothetical protein ACO1OB_27940 [Archangium sp.]